MRAGTKHIWCLRFLSNESSLQLRSSNGTKSQTSSQVLRAWKLATLMRIAGGFEFNEGMRSESCTTFQGQKFCGCVALYTRHKAVSLGIKSLSRHRTQERAISVDCELRTSVKQLSMKAQTVGYLQAKSCTEKLPRLQRRTAMLPFLYSRPSFIS